MRMYVVQKRSLQKESPCPTGGTIPPIKDSVNQKISPHAQHKLFKQVFVHCFCSSLSGGDREAAYQGGHLNTF